MALTAKQRAFVNEYLIDFNATRAAGRAGHKGDDNVLAVTGYRLLRNAKIAEAIKTRLSERALLADEVLMRLGEQARSNIGEFIRFDDNGNPLFDLQAASVLGKLPLVKKLKTKTRTYSEPFFNHEIDEMDQRDVNETTIEFELYSSQAALELLGKHHGLFERGATLDNPIHTVGWTVEEWKKEQAKRRDEAATTMDIFDEDGGE